MSRMLRIGLVAGAACLLLAAGLSARGARAVPDSGDITIPFTSTHTPPISSVQTRTHTPTRTATRTPRPTNTATARPTATRTPLPIAPNPTAPPGVATVPPPDLPVAVPSATNTPLSVVVPTPEPTEFPVGVPAATSTLPSFSAGETPDLVATAIEVTQGMQNLANDMPLVEGRLTVARVYVKTQDPDVPAANVKGVLAAFRDGQYIGVEYPENGPISAVPDGGLRLNIDDSLYFYLPDAWTTGQITLRTFVYATTPDAPYDEEPTEMNNFAEVGVQFQDGDPLELRLAPLHLHVLANPNNSDITYHYDNNESDALAIILGVLRLHPIGTNDLAFNTSSHLVLEGTDGPNIAVSSIKPLGHQDDVEWNLSVADDRHAANERIAFFKSMAPEPYQDWRWYGMVDQSVSMGGFIGWASNGGTHGLMDNSTSEADWNNMGGYALAHEIAHIFLSAPEHVACSGGESGPDPDYPYPEPNCQLADIDPEGYYGFDTYWQLWGLPGPEVISNDPGAPANQFAFPMMGSQRPWWLDPFYYCRLLDAYGIACDPLALNVAGRTGDDTRHVHARSIDDRTDAAIRARLEPPRRLVRGTADGYIYVSARVDAVAGTAAFIDIMRMVDPAPGAVEASRLAQDNPQPSDYMLVLDDAVGNTLASYPIPPSEPAGHGAPAGNPLFTGIVPYFDGTAFIRLRRADTVLAERAVSAQAPVVRVLSPNGSESLSDNMEVRWEASDPDGDALRFTVMYSNDAGATWLPLATDLRGNELSLAAIDEVPGSERALIRVLASDGVRTTADDSDAVFGVPDAPPQPYIIGPADGATFPEGASVTLMGGANDLEDGALSGDSLRWSSSIDGDLGAGHDVRTRDLQPGTHAIELSATDQVGGVDRRTVEITIGDPRTGQPDQDERDRAADLLLNGKDDGGGTPWLIIGIGAAAAAMVSIAVAALATMRLRRRSEPGA